MTQRLPLWKTYSHAHVYVDRHRCAYAHIYTHMTYSVTTMFGGVTYSGPDNNANLSTLPQSK